MLIQLANTVARDWFLEGVLCFYVTCLCYVIILI